MSESILDHELISARYFYPRREEFAEPFWVDCGDVKLSCYYRQTAPDAKTVIYFHGNGEEVSDYLEFFVPIFGQMGFNLLLAEYRGYAMSTGEPALAAMLGDVGKIIEAVGQPPEKIVLYGRSIGSLYAVHGASLFPNISGLILESGIAVLLERLLMRIQPHELGVTLEQMEKAVEKDFDHQKKLAGFEGSTLVMHAEHDNLVHCSHGKKLYDWAPEPKNLKLFEKGDHNDIFYVNMDEYFKLIYLFLTGL